MHSIQTPPAAQPSVARPLPEEIRHLAQEIGTFVQHCGFKNIHGRLWAHLFISPRPLDASALIRRLGVSKALISMSIKEMLQHEVVRIVGKSPEGTTLYDVNPDITGIILKILKQRESKMLERISTTFQALDRLTPESREILSQARVQALGELISAGRSTLEGFLGPSREA